MTTVAMMKCGRMSEMSNEIDIAAPLGVNDHLKQVLRDVRKLYGHTNQILVCMEELNELSCVLAEILLSEYEPIEESLYIRLIDEFADVNVILDHVQEIFRIEDRAIGEALSDVQVREEDYPELGETLISSIQKLNALSCALAKYPRYEDEEKAASTLQMRVLNCTVELVLALNCLQLRANMSNKVVRKAVASKIERVERWIASSPSMKQTLIDREVNTK